MAQRLYRSRSDRKIAGVCGGIGEYFEVDPLLVRAAFVLGTIIYGGGVLAYIVLWFLTPERDEILVDPVNNIYTEDYTNSTEKIAKSDYGSKKTTLGIILIIIGMLFLLNNFIPSLDHRYYFPISLILIGGYIVSKQLRRRTGGNHEA